MFHAGAVVDEGLVFVAPCLMSQIGIGGYLCRLNRTWRAYLLSCGKLRALFFLAYAQACRCSQSGLSGVWNLKD